MLYIPTRNDPKVCYSSKCSAEGSADAIAREKAVLDLYENDGFIVHYFSEEKVNSLVNGFKNISLEKFEEGTFPRKLFFVVNEKK